MQGPSGRLVVRTLVCSQLCQASEDKVVIQAVTLPLKTLYLEAAAP